MSNLVLTLAGRFGAPAGDGAAFASSLAEDAIDFLWQPHLQVRAQDLSYHRINTNVNSLSYHRINISSSCVSSPCVWMLHFLK